MTLSRPTFLSAEVSTRDSEYINVMKAITELVGKPKNYGPSPEEQQEENRKNREESQQKLAMESAERKRRNKAALAEMTAHYEEWVSPQGRESKS